MLIDGNWRLCAWRKFNFKDWQWQDALSLLYRTVPELQLTPLHCQNLHDTNLGSTWFQKLHMFRVLALESEAGRKSLLFLSKARGRKHQLDPLHPFSDHGNNIQEQFCFFSNRTSQSNSFGSDKTRHRRYSKNTKNCSNRSENQIDLHISSQNLQNLWQALAQAHCRDLLKRWTSKWRQET